MDDLRRPLFCFLTLLRMLGVAPPTTERLTRATIADIIVRYLS